MRYKAFVSSTFEDLKDHRAAVIDALRKAGIHVDPMEEWTASTGEPKVFSQDRMKDCDLCILLVAYRRGHVPAGDTNSITQLEYRAALKAGLDVHVYMLEEDALWRARFDERRDDALIGAWRQELMHRHGVESFEHDPASIKIKVAPALFRWVNERPNKQATVRRPLSNIQILGKPFVGRDQEFPDIRGRLVAGPPPRVVVLAGPPGIGKSELAREYARRSIMTYEGGSFAVNCDGDGLPVDLATIGRVLLRDPLMIGLSLEDQCRATLYSLGNQQLTLLILENARAPEAIARWLPTPSQACHVLVTTSQGNWNRFDVLELQPLNPDDSFALTKSIGAQIPDDLATALAMESGGSPMQIGPQAAAFAKDAARGLLSVDDAPADQAASYRRAYNQLEPSARVLLHAAAIFRPNRVPREDLCRTVLDVIGGDLSNVRRWLVACQDRYMLTGHDELQMDQLLQDFVTNETLESSWAEQLAMIRKRQWQDFRELAKAVAENPVDTTSAGRLTAFRPDVTAWDETMHGAQVEELRKVGSALSELGQFRTARPWFERAAQTAAKGDLKGRIDHQSLSDSLHEVGDCLVSLGDFDAAKPWFERAVESGLNGDVHGHIDHQSLGMSLHQIGYCLSSLGKVADARLWYERAVEAKQKGKVDGSIDHQSLGTSLHQVGYCLSSIGEFGTAMSWSERAVEAKEKGGAHGRIDYQNLAASLHLVGYCLSKLKRFSEARPWFERAVDATGKGDLHGRVDFETLGRSHHQVGNCLASLGQFADAKPYFERAVEAKRKGDVYGRVNHQSLGGSLYQVGNCWSNLGNFAEAKQWFGRAVEAAEKGDVHGRIDHQSLGRSLQRVGDCLSNLGEFASARVWLERAVVAAEKGDIYGVVNDGILGGVLQSAAACLRHLGDTARAEGLEERARRLKR